jgi:hypothetical protein
MNRFLMVMFLLVNLEGYIKETLLKISKDTSININDIEELIFKGRWNMQPLEIPNNQLNWHIW